MALVYLSLAFVLGIYLGSHFTIPWSVALPIIIATLIVALLLRKKGPLLLVGLCIALFFCGAIRFGAVPSGDDLQYYVANGEVEIVGVVAEEPEPKDSSMAFVLAAREIDGERVKGNILVRTTRYPTYQYGDLLKMTGEFGGAAR